MRARGDFRKEAAPRRFWKTRIDAGTRRCDAPHGDRWAWAWSVLVLLAVGCRDAREAPTVVEFWAMGREGELVQRLVPAFEAQHPGWHVRVQQVPWSAAHEKLLTAFVGGSMPDVFQLGNTWIPEFVALHAVEPLDAWIATRDEVPRRRLLSRGVGYQRRRPDDVRRAVVRRHAPALLSRRSVRGGRHRCGAGDVGGVARVDDACAADGRARSPRDPPAVDRVGASGDLRTAARRALVARWGSLR